MARKLNVAQSGHTILVVDDQEETRLSVCHLLRRQGHRVLTAESGERALGLLKEHDVHLVLVDYFMPRMSGAQLVREVRTFDPFVQIIMLTGSSGGTPPRAMLAELAIQGYHDKGEGPEKLLVWVDVGLKAHRTVSELQERERRQRELVANVSHEFRTPLNIIGGYTDLLMDGTFGSLPGEALEPLRTLAVANSNLLGLVTDFLKYAKAEADAVAVAEQPIATEELARELSRLGTVLLDGKDVRFTVCLDNAPRQFFTDPIKLRTILRNLVTNAVNFTTTGTIALRVRLDAGLRFSVEDTGAGIRAEELAIIFEPFRQREGASKRACGPDLSLALSRKLARLLGGDITAQSELGVGSVFTLVLPARVACMPDSQTAAGLFDTGGAAAGSLAVGA